MVLLTAINAKYIHSNLAVYSLKAYAAKYEREVELAEYTINHSKGYILQKIFERHPDVVAFSCYIWNIEYVLDIARNLKKVMPQVSIIVGGPEVSYDAEDVLENNSFIDLVMLGEGEQTFLEYLEYYIEGSKTLSHINGIAYRHQGNIRITPPREIMDLDAVVFPYGEMADLKNRIVYYETSRGCPFSCSYCLSSIDKKIRFRSLDKVKRELTFFLEKNVPQVKFVDRTFNCNHEHAYEIWKYIGQNDNGITNFHFEIAADLLREEDYELFRTFRPGLIQLEIGVQSTNSDTIEAIHRKMDLNQLKNAVAKVREGRNIHQHLDLIAGLPYEDYESFQKSFNEVYDMKPDQLQLGFLKVLKGSYMGETKDDYGMMYDSQPPYEVLCTKWLSYEDIIRLKSVEEMVEIYYNSFQFSASIAFLLKYHKSSFGLFESLGNYYKEKGFLSEAKSRISRYTILQQYFKEQITATEKEQEQFEEALTFDLFLRDNVKSPPDFVRKKEADEMMRLRQFYDDEASQNQYLPEYKGFTGRQLASMTYIQKFSFDVEKLIEQSIMEECPGYYLFEYRGRNPLNHSARTICLSALS